MDCLSLNFKSCFLGDCPRLCELRQFKTDFAGENKVPQFLRARESPVRVAADGFNRLDNWTPFWADMLPAVDFAHCAKSSPNR